MFIFLPVVLLVYYGLLRKSRPLQNIFLFLASLFFYAWGEPWFVLIMLISVVMNWLFAIVVDLIRSHTIAVRVTLGLMIFANLALLFRYKYWMFTLTNINNLFGSHFPIPDITLPIGISFFTFQAISYVIDIYRRKGEAQLNPINVGLYIAFFPQLIAGPIVRYETVAEQIQDRVETWDDFTQGVCRFMVGLSKKVLLANTLALVADQAFSAGDERSVMFAWLGALAYTFQIYFDFSGYSDMAIGLGKMFGFHFLENFNYPYISRSVSEFWRRWHISLGTWFKDYVYIPLGGSRVKSKARLYFNLFVVWSLTGLWHGANWTFICWGLLYYCLLVFEKTIGFEKRFNDFAVLKNIYTMFFVIMGWVLFRSESIGAAGQYMLSMFGLTHNPLVDGDAWRYLIQNRYFFLFAFLGSLPIIPMIPKKIRNAKITAIIYPVVLIALFLVAVSYIVKGAYNPFIYFNF